MTVPSKEPRVHTLEDVAEGVLNGMLCTYEPPDPRRMGHQPSILRRKQTKHRGGNRHIRWKDEPPSTPKIMNWNDTVQRACIDASLELGCKPMMDTETALAKARSKSPRTQTHLVFDDEGFPKYRDERFAREPPPSVPALPPPSKREPFLPQLCGIPLGCGGDDPSQNSALVDEIQYDLAAAELETYRRARPVEGKVVPIVDEYLSSSDEEVGADWASASMNSSSSLFYRVFANRKRKDTKRMAKLEEGNSDDSGIAKSRKKKSAGRLKRLTKLRDSKSSDWDESVPVIPLEVMSAKKQENRRQRDSPLKPRSRSVSPRRRSRSASPGLKSPARRQSSIRRRSQSPASHQFPKRSSRDNNVQKRDSVDHQMEHCDRQSYIGAFREGFVHGPPSQLPEWDTSAPVRQQEGRLSQSYLSNPYDNYQPQVGPAMYHRDGRVFHPNHIRSTRRRSKSPIHSSGRDFSRSPTNTPPRRNEMPYGPNGFYHYPDGSIPRYFDPTNPQAFTVAPPLPMHYFASGYQQSQIIPQETKPPDNTAAEKGTSSDLTWEDRTRLAWDQIRSGVAALTMDAKNKVEHTTATAQHDPNQAHPEQNTLPMMQSPSFPRDQHKYHARKVSFGKPQQLVYYDDQSQRSCSTRGSSRSKKKKLRLRGTKAIGATLSRMKKTFRSKPRSRQAQSDDYSEASSNDENLSRSHTWGSDPIELDRRREPGEVLHDDYGRICSSDHEQSPKRADSNPLSNKN